MQNIIFTIVLLSCLLFTSCSQGGKKLGVLIKNESLCIYTPNYDGKKGIIFDSLIYAFLPNEKRHTGERVNIYYQTHYRVEYPIKKNECILIPLSHFKTKTPYSLIVYGNDNYYRDFCVVEHYGKLYIQDSRIETEAHYCD